MIQYVRGCAECQHHKVNTRPTKAPLTPIFPEPKANPFEVIALDFITKLPKSQKYDSILTITDHDCSKASLFIPCVEEITAEGVAKLFVQRVFRYYGLPRKIISDRDPRFTSKFAKELCRLLGIRQNISTAYHPRTDRQSERTNQWLETYLRFFVNYQQDDWAAYLPLAEFAHNNWKNTSTGESPFYLLMGSHPRAEWSDTPSALPQAMRRLGQIKEIRAQAQEAMTRTQMMWVKHRDTPKYHEGDLVWLEGHNLRTNQPTAKLAAQRHGPFPVEQVLSPVTYKLSLPSTWNVHPVFHIDLLTPYRETPFHGRNYERPPPDLVANQEEYEVEKVLDARHYGRKKIRQYLVKWKGYPDSDNEWVSQKDMSADKAIQEYEEELEDKRESNSAKRRIRHLMSSSLISVTSSPSTPTHSQLLSSLVDDELSEARAIFPTPPPGRVSPDSMQSLDLASTTGIQDAGTEDDSEEVGGGAAPPSESEDRGTATVLLVRNLDRDEEESEGSSRVQCEAAQGDPCRFHTPFAVQRCDTHGERHE